MFPKSKLIPALTAGAALATVALVVTRRVRRGHRIAVATPASLEPPSVVPPRRDSEVVPRVQASSSGVAVRRIMPVAEAEHISARPSDHAPRGPGPDDQEPLDADDLASIWLTGAAQSEHSLSEGETSLDPDDLLASLPAPELNEDRPSLTGDE